MTTTMRLQRRMAQLGIASRRESERLIAAGRVQVNGVVVTEPGTQVGAEDVVAVDDRVAEDAGPMTVILHKPRGTICARVDPEGRPTVYELLPPGLPYLGHVGRLDFQTEGVLFFTNERGLADGLLQPGASVPRTYEVKIRGRLSDASRRRIEAGLPLDGRPTRPAVVERIGDRDSKHDWLRVVLFEGRNRHIHRIFEAVGHSVTKLHRVSFAGIGLEGLRPGDSRPLTRAEIECLRAFSAEADPPPRSGRGGGPRRKPRGRSDG